MEKENSNHSEQAAHNYSRPAQLYKRFKSISQESTQPAVKEIDYLAIPDGIPSLISSEPQIDSTFTMNTHKPSLLSHFTANSNAIS